MNEILIIADYISKPTTYVGIMENCFSCLPRIHSSYFSDITFILVHSYHLCVLNNHGVFIKPKISMKTKATKLTFSQDFESCEPKTVKINSFQ